ncbi:MAG: hypothetical protein ACOYW3_07125 [Bacteroidota bacterium]
MNIKRLLLSLCGIAWLSVSSCDTDDPGSARELAIVPVRLQQADYAKELSFDNHGRLAKVIITSEMPDGTILESTQEFEFDGETPIRCTTNYGFRMEYTYDGGVIVRTDEFLNGTFSQFHTFSYDDHGRVAEIISWQNIPEEGGLIPHNKGVYEYDETGNVLFQRLYYYNTDSKDHELLTVFEYSDYDSFINSEQLFNAFPFNPLFKFSKNNPGKMVVKNANGIVSTTDEHIYTYNARGYAIHKTTKSSFRNGESGTYETAYVFEEKSR